MEQEASKNSLLVAGKHTDAAIRRVFYRLGLFLVDHHRVVMATVVVFVLACLGGLPLIVSESDPSLIWVPQDSEAQTQKAFVESKFPTTPRVQTLVLFASDRSTSLLSPARFAAAWSATDALTSVKDSSGTTFASLCYKDSRGGCVINSIFSVFGNNGTRIGELSEAQLLASINAAESSGALSRTTIDSMLGNNTRDAAGKITAATVLRVSWISDGDSDAATALRWERAWFQEAEKQVDSLLSNHKIDGVFTFAKSIETELARSISENIIYMVLAFIIIIVYSSFSLGQRDRVESKIALSQAGIFCVAGSIGVSFGLGGYLGITYVAPNSVVPFLILGVGVDDMFIIVDTFERQLHKYTLRERVARGLADSGSSITMTSITSVLAFAVGTTTVLPAMRSFCTYATVAVLFDYLFQVTFFVCALYLDARRRQQQRYDVCCWRTRAVQDIEAPSEDSHKHEHGHPSTDSAVVEVLSRKHSADSDGEAIPARVIATDEFSDNDSESDDDDSDEHPTHTSTKKNAWTVHPQHQGEPQHDPASQPAHSIKHEADDGPPAPSKGSLHGDALPRSDNTDSFGNPLPSAPLPRFMQQRLAPFMLHPVTKVLVLLIFFGVFGVNVWAATQVQQDFTVKDLAPDGSYLIRYEEETDRIWDDLPLVVSIYTKRAVEYHTDAVAKGILDLHATANDLDKHTYINGAGKWWYTTYIEWLNATQPALTKTTHGIPTTRDSFYATLRQFLDGSGAPFVADIIFVDNNRTQIDTSRMGLELKAVSNTTGSVRRMAEARKLARASSVPDLFVYSYEFIFTEQFAIIELEAIQNLAVAAVVVMIICAIFLIHPAASLFVMICIVMIDAGLLGALFYSDRSIDSVTVANLVMAVGLSVDYSAHIAHQFVTMPGRDRNERITKVYGQMGASVLYGAFSTFLGICLLGVSQSAIFRTFWALLTSTVLLGLGHGLLFLPVLLSLVGPKPVEHAHIGSEDLVDEHREDSG